MFLFILFDFIHKTTSYFGHYSPSLLLIGKLYFYQTPYQLLQVIPIASLIGSVLTMVVMSRSGEITAMRAAGMSAFQIGSPLGFGGVLLTIGCVLLGEFVVPLSSQKLHYVTEVLIEGNKQDQLTDEARWLKNDNQIFNFKEYHTSTQTLHEIKIVDLSPFFIPKKATHASKARYNDQTGEWSLEGVKILHFDAQNKLEKIDTLPHLNLRLPVEPKKLKSERRQPDEMSLVELSDYVRRGRKHGVDILPYEIAWHLKCSFPLAAFLVCLLGLRFGYRFERKTETVRSVLTAFGVGISYWFILSAARALGMAGDISPMLAGWMATMILSSLVAIDLWRISRI